MGGVQIWHRKSNGVSVLEVKLTDVGMFQTVLTARRAHVFVE